MNRKIFAGLALAAAVTLVPMSAYAEDAAAKSVQTSTKATSNDGLVTIDLPDTTWTQVSSEQNAAVFSDGSCAIILDVYASGDTLPKIASADANHALVYQAAGSTKEYTYVATAYITSMDEYDAIKNSINSISIDSSKVSEALSKKKVNKDEYTISAQTFTAWVKADEGVNMRKSYSQDAAVYTILDYGTEVTVTGVVLHNGEETGWARINYGGEEGYVSMQFLSTSQPSESKPANTVTPTPKSESAERTGNSMQLYYWNSNAVDIYEYTDGTWRDENGVQYWGTVENHWTNSNGEELYTYIPDLTSESRTGYSVVLYWGTSDTQIVYAYEDGTWRDDEGVKYTDNHDGTWTSSTGSTLYERDPYLDWQESQTSSDSSDDTSYDDTNYDDTNYDDTNYDDTEYYDGSEEYVEYTEE